MAEMGLSTPILGAGLAALALASLGTQRQTGFALQEDAPARQIAYAMRLYHQSAIAFKTANPAATGALSPAAPGFLTEWRFQSCADAKHVLTVTSGLNTRQNRDVASEAIRQAGAGQGNGVPGIGLSDGVFVNSGFAPYTSVCAAAAGAAAMQTQVFP